MSTSRCSRRARPRWVALGVALALAVGLAGSALAQTTTHYALEWHVIGGGGQPVSSASYRVNSTVGQGAAGPPRSTSASYAVTAGYWSIGGEYWAYLPVVLRLVP